jgi:hypothetical protein
MVMLWREVALPTDLTMEEPSTEDTQGMDYAQEMWVRMQRSHDRVHECLAECSKTKMKQRQERL